MTHLQIQMNYILLVHMMDPLNDLLDKEYGFTLGDVILGNNPLKQFTSRDAVSQNVVKDNV